MSFGSAADGFEGPFAGRSPAEICVGSGAGAFSAGPCGSLGSPGSPVDGSLGLEGALELLGSPEPPADGPLGLEGNYESDLDQQVGNFLLLF